MVKIIVAGGFFPANCTRLLPTSNFFTALLTNFTLHYQNANMLGLKKNKFNIFCAWTLLICFVAGQYMVYVHQHMIIQKSAGIYSVAKNQSKPAAII